MRVTEVIKIEVTQQPCNPVYLRWLNKFGGWDYYCFGKTQTKGIEIDGQEFEKPVLHDLENMTSREAFLNKQAFETILVGAENISNDEVLGIKGMLTSAKVEMYLRGKWFEVLIDTGGYTILETEHNRSEIEVAISMPSLYIQGQ
jgi:hypothetical protein